MIVASSSVVASVSLPFVGRGRVDYLMDRTGHFASTVVAAVVITGDQLGSGLAVLGPADLPVRAGFE